MTSVCSYHYVDLRMYVCMRTQVNNMHREVASISSGSSVDGSGSSGGSGSVDDSSSGGGG